MRGDSKPVLKDGRELALKLEHKGTSWDYRMVMSEEVGWAGSRVLITG